MFLFAPRRGAAGRRQRGEAFGQTYLAEKAPVYGRDPWLLTVILYALA